MAITILFFKKDKRKEGVTMVISPLFQKKSNPPNQPASQFGRLAGLMACWLGGWLAGWLVWFRFFGFLVGFRRGMGVTVTTLLHFTRGEGRDHGHCPSFLLEEGGHGP